jgi:hypothetical protein
MRLLSEHGGCLSVTMYVAALGYKAVAGLPESIAC